MQITLNQLDHNLQADLRADITGFEFYEIALKAGGDVHVAFNGQINRAGLVYVGGGSNGMTHWTDATSVADAVRRFESDDMLP